jgi:hypothetical protein
VGIILLSKVKILNNAFTVSARNPLTFYPKLALGPLRLLLYSINDLVKPVHIDPVTLMCDFHFHNETFQIKQPFITTLIIETKETFGYKEVA